jgi:hypothetical protein
MFSSERVFSSRNNDSMEIEWFFSAREGIYGPYESKEIAEKGLCLFIADRITSNHDGGRKDTEKDGIPFMATKNSMVLRGVYEPKKQKRGVESLNFSND